MITYNGLDLFSSGPGTVDPGRVASRQALADSPGGVGASVVTQGTSPRELTQSGTLVADDAASLRALIDTVEAQVGAGGHELIDQHGQAWPDCLMQRFEPGGFYRLGPRIAAEYEVVYLQTNP